MLVLMVCGCKRNSDVLFSLLLAATIENRKETKEDSFAHFGCFNVILDLLLSNGMLSAESAKR